MAPPLRRRRTDPQPSEITFDPSARQEYLSGFHKRKQQRIQNAKDTAAKREKEERVRERKQLREQRKEDLQRHVTEVNAELNKQNQNLADESESDAESSGDQGAEWDGVEAEAEVAEVLPSDEEFVDEDKYTTVTVEAMDGEGDDAVGEDDDEEGVAVKTAASIAEGKPKVAKKRVSSKDGQAKAKKKKKFRYESKAERKSTREKQKSKNHKAKLRRTGK